MKVYILTHTWVLDRETRGTYLVGAFTSEKKAKIAIGAWIARYNDNPHNKKRLVLTFDKNGAPVVEYAAGQKISYSDTDYYFGIDEVVIDEEKMISV